jgi:hypothetical protein
MVWPFQKEVLPKVSLAHWVLLVSAGFLYDGSRLM